MRLISLSIALAIAVIPVTPLTCGAGVDRLESVEFKGNIYNPKNISAIGLIKGFLIIGSDEGNKVQILRRDGDGYEVFRDLTLDKTAKEIDIEGITCEGDTVYVVGSHSRKRKKVKEDNTYSENRKRILEVEREASVERLYRFKLDADGQASQLTAISLMPAIQQEPIHKEFARLPGKENGVDVEGIAIREGRLYVGFRGPVLRGNYVPVLTCRFENPVSGTRLLFVNLAGLGVRDITSVKDGFLILAGPVGDGPGSYQLYFWDGRDCLPGKRDPGEQAGRVELLGNIATEGDAKAEGITVLEERDSVYEVIIVFDGLERGGAARYRITRP